ncbi:hypothetical protein F5Y00DRAFT_270618 [Daldinia vernicosa]|uniref:uncharacterized protein n=1 Tax=Daldinia vernicosa TaxID=114800 RepID=UPI00200850D7|nr:uncharacterized protein F5Y00DRAFT_270618 [Daldinia vernicosa]KAI0853441.1 hypothetical protein F5Y00DRAFT_270618 [Daldinia vernicosa]
MSLTYFIVDAIKVGYITWVSVILIRLIITFISSFSFIKQHRPPSSNSTQYILVNRAVASFGFLQENKLQNRLVSRAIPNGRLVNVFGVDNAFTTTSVITYRRFIQRVGPGLRNKNPEKWHKFFNSASTTLDLILTDFRGVRYSLPVAIIARQLVFVSTLHSFFNVDPKDVNLSDVGVATELINILWVQSKTEPQPDSLREGRIFLEVALQRILPDKFPCSAQDHPLNIIIPAYETMWRVVLLTFISAGFRDVDRETGEQFRKVLECVPKCFKGGKSKDMRTMAVNFSKEGLRLYPPTKSIYRAVPTEPQDSDFVTYDEQIIADIQECHRDPNIWINPTQFRPSRFLPGEFTDAMKNAYLPFSIAPHRCPAADTFAPHAIIVLVVVLAKGLGTLESGANVRFGDARLDGDTSALLPSGRLDMENWELEMNDAV